MKIALLGVPTSVGSHHAGQELAPAAVRDAGLVGLLRQAGHDVQDLGDLDETPHVARPRVDGVRAAEEVRAIVRSVAEAVERIPDDCVPLVVGGDCTLSLGVMIGLRHRRPHVVYVDGDADLSTPGTSDSGVLDSMGIAHLLGRGHPGLVADVARAGLSGPDITLFGTNPTELDDARRDWARAEGIDLVDADVVARDPVAAARAIEPRGRPLLVHVDVDVLDSGEVPLANFPLFGGLGLADLEDCLRVLGGHPLAGVVLTEVNPSYDSTGTHLPALLGALAALFPDAG